VIRYADIGCPYHVSEDYPDAPDGPPSEYELSACAHCEQLLAEQHNLFDALEIGCLLGRNSAQVEMCWSIERERRAGKGMLR
jgi:hypothetical protein